MARRSFTVDAKWDDEAKVYYSESDIIGLHIEAETLEEFEQVMMQEAPDLIVANHLTAPELSRGAVADRHPTLLDAGPARVAGELFLDEKQGNLFWFVNVESGRYCRIAPPSESNISNVVRWFREIVQDDVQLDDISVE